MLALLDGDIFCYRCAAVSENESFDIAVFRVVDAIELTLAAVGAESYQLWLSDKRENNFRREIYSEYKANRTQPDPIHLQALKQFLIDEWEANVATGQEADDALGIEQCKAEFGSSIICSIDKDLKQIPGRHYNFVKQEFDEVTPEEGIKFFYKQTLIGDRADNIFGVKGIGPIKAAKLIDHLGSESDMYAACLNAYGDEGDRLIMNGKVLWIRQKPDQIWSPPDVTVV